MGTFLKFEDEIKTSLIVTFKTFLLYLKENDKILKEPKI